MSADRWHDAALALLRREYERGVEEGRRQAEIEAALRATEAAGALSAAGRRMECGHRSWVELFRHALSLLEYWPGLERLTPEQEDDRYLLGAAAGRKDSQIEGWSGQGAEGQP